MIICDRKKGFKEVALIFVEGETEVEFYKLIFEKHLDRLPKRVINLHGNFGIYNKIFDKTVTFLSNNPKKQTRIYCCIDRESRYGEPIIDINILSDKFISHTDFKGKVLSVDVILATQMIESWFFHDIQSIFKFLKVPVTKRNPSKYKPVKRLTADDLYKLFSNYGKVYIKGHKCRNFIDNLDLNKIFRKCKELREGINLIINNNAKQIP